MGVLLSSGQLLSKRLLGTCTCTNILDCRIEKPISTMTINHLIFYDLFNKHLKEAEVICLVFYKYIFTYMLISLSNKLQEQMLIEYLWYFSEGDINGHFLFFKVNGQDSCGQVHWQATKTKAKSLQKLDETGVMVAGCRHALMQKAVNMWTGEMYGYGFYLQVRVVV